MKKLLVTLMVLGLASSAYAGEGLYKKCISCHGAKGEKAAMGGKSKVINAMSKTDLVASMKGYKDGTYGGAMKVLMKGQVASFSDAQIEELATYITTLK